MYGQNFDYRTPGASLPPLYPGPMPGQQQPPQPYQMNQWGAAVGQMPAGMPGQPQYGQIPTPQGPPMYGAPQRQYGPMQGQYGGGPAMGVAAPGSGVIVNGVELNMRDAQVLQTLVGPVLPGDYWYDNKCGAWGRKGGPCEGVITAGLNIGGPLRPDASSGTTGVFINGRQLHLRDVMELRMYGINCIPGRWWLDAAGNCGLEGGPAMFNLLAAAKGQLGQMQQGQSEGPLMYMGDGKVAGTVTSGRRVYHF